MKTSQNSLGWLKIEGYKANNNTSKTITQNNLAWLRVDCNEQNVKSMFTEVSSFFHVLYSF